MYPEEQSEKVRRGGRSSLSPPDSWRKSSLEPKLHTDRENTAEYYRQQACLSCWCASESQEESGCSRALSYGTDIHSITEYMKERVEIEVEFDVTQRLSSPNESMKEKGK